MGSNDTIRHVPTETLCFALGAAPSQTKSVSHSRCISKPHAVIVQKYHHILNTEKLISYMPSDAVDNDKYMNGKLHHYSNY